MDWRWWILAAVDVCLVVWLYRKVRREEDL